MYYVISILVGILFGVTITVITGKRRNVAGTIHFYENEDSEQPTMIAELFENPADISKRKYVEFKVSRK